MMPVLGKTRVFAEGGRHNTDEGGRHNTDEDVNKNEENVSTVFFLLLTVMKICGILFIHADGNCKTRREILIVHVIYCFIIQTIAFLNALRYILAFVSEGTRWQYHIAVLSFAWFYFVIVYFGIMCLFCCKHMTKFFKLFHQYQIDHGIHFDIQKYKRNIRIIAIVLFVEITISSIGMPVVIILGWIPAESPYGMMLWPMHTASGSLLIIAGVSYAMVSVFAYTSCLLMVMFYFFVLACIKKELQYISSSLEDLRHKEAMNITTGLEDIRQQHQSIVNLLSSVNPILRHVVGGFYAMGIPTICCMLYGLSSGTILLDDLYRMIFTILGNIVGMFVLTFKGADINSEAHTPLDILHDYDLAILPEKTVNQIAVFTNRLIGPPIGVSVYGMFVVDYSTVLMVFGTIITYAIIVIQFSSSVPVCNSAAFNNTNTTYIV